MTDKITAAEYRARKKGIPQKSGGVGSKHYTPDEFKGALRCAGDLLVLHRFGDGFTLVEEFKGRRRISKLMVLDEQADIIEENFEEETQWK